MKFTSSKTLLALTCSFGGASALLPAEPSSDGDCASKKVSMEHVGSLPVGSSNWASPVPIKNSLFFINQVGKEIYSWKNGEMHKLFEESDKPDGVSWDYSDSLPEYIVNVAPGPMANEVYVLLGSATLPAGILAAAGTLPTLAGESVGPSGSEIEVDNLYNSSAAINEIFSFPVSTIYNHIIYKFKWAGNKLKDPEPIIAFEVQGGGTHKGKSIIRPRDDEYCCI
jgi:hypothetical protein